MALGYVLGKGSARLVKTNLNIPLALMLSVIPDIDILAEHIDGLASVIPHRGPIHSVLVALVVFIPIFIIYHKAALPYFIALIQHALIGDYFVGGQLELFWPITPQKFGFPTDIQSIQNVGLELSL
ncbi:MAG TPA: metal-dependent hydrolase, partial [Patescibacteria group bacterium]|nr:metal-dependent hydrolase [Patescibacteria group bacterium]